MDSSIFRLSLDIHRQTTQAHLAVRKSDTARKIVAALSDGGRPYCIAEGCYAVFKGKKPDGNVLYNNCTIENNCIVYEFTEQTAASAGYMPCEFQLYGPDEKIITSPKFSLIVSGLVYDDSEVESSGEFTALEKAMADVAELKATGLRGDEGPMGPQGPMGPTGKPFRVTVFPGGIVEDPYDDLQREYEAGRELICRLETDDQQKLDLPLVEAKGQPYVFRFNAISGGVEWTVEISYRDGGAAVAAVTSNSLGKPTLYVDLVGNDPKALKSSVPFADIVAAHNSGRAVAVRLQSYRVRLVSIAADYAVFQCTMGSAYVYIAIWDDDATTIQIDYCALQSDLEGLEAAPEVHIGPEEPTDPHVVVWINPDDEPPVPGGTGLSGYAKKEDIPTDEHINSLINTALVGIPNAAEVAY